jgi:DNA-binding response OmpR family regulator
MRLLLIEDDYHVISALRRRLRSSYIIDVASNANEGQHLAEVNDYDLIMLDLNLPDRSGLTVCANLRESGFNIPILVITGIVEVGNKINLLDSGADDYLTKPFNIDELKARIRALVRRDSETISSSITELGGVILDSACRTVSRNGSEIILRRKEFDLLEYMMMNTGKTLSRQMIMDHVWEANDNLWTNAIDVHIKYLRDKVDRPFGTKMIKTVHGIGYKFEPWNKQSAAVAGN